jgi:hypothetical protein
VIVVALMAGLNALDGYDVLSISWAAPGIAAEWGIGRDALGIVLSMELVGMALGSACARAASAPPSRWCCATRPDLPRDWGQIHLREQA